MPVNVSNMYIENFRSDVQHVSQQTMSKLQGCVDVRMSGAEKEDWNLIDSIELNDKTAPCPPTPDCPLNYTKRISIPKEYDCGHCVDKGQIEKILVDPKMDAVKRLAAAKARKVDDVIIASVQASALNDAGQTDDFNSDNLIDDAANPFSFSATTDIMRKFLENDVDFDESKCAVIGPTQVQEALNLIQLTGNGTDAAAREYLTSLQGSGIVDSWLGFKWILSTRLLSGAAGTLDLLFFAEDALGLQVNADYEVDIAQDPSISFNWRIYARTHIGAVRVRDEKTFVLRVADANV